IPDIQIEAEYRAYADFARKYPEDFKRYLPEIRETTKNDADKYRLDDIVDSLDSTKHRLEDKKEVASPLIDPVVPKVPVEVKVQETVLVAEEKPEKSKGIFSKVKSWLRW